MTLWVPSPRRFRLPCLDLAAAPAQQVRCESHLCGSLAAAAPGRQVHRQRIVPGIADQLCCLLRPYFASCRREVRVFLGTATFVGAAANLVCNATLSCFDRMHVLQWHRPLNHLGAVDGGWSDCVSHLSACIPSHLWPVARAGRWRRGGERKREMVSDGETGRNLPPEVHQKHSSRRPASRRWEQLMRFTTSLPQTTGTAAHLPRRRRREAQDLIRFGSIRRWIGWRRPTFDPFWHQSPDASIHSRISDLGFGLPQAPALARGGAAPSTGPAQCRAEPYCLNKLRISSYR